MGGGVVLLKGGWGRVEETKVHKVGGQKEAEEKEEEEEEEEECDNGLSFESMLSHL